MAVDLSIEAVRVLQIPTIFVVTPANSTKGCSYYHLAGGRKSLSRCAVPHGRGPPFVLQPFGADIFVLTCCTA